MLEVQDGSFRQEPGSGVSGIVQGSAVAVGNLEWVRSHSQPHSESQHASTSGSQASSDRIGSRHDAHNGASTDSFRGSPHQTLQHDSLDSSSNRSSSTSSSMDSGIDQSVEMRERRSSNGGASSSQAGSNSGLITVYVGVDGKLAGCFKISDQLRSEAAATITGLQQQGIEAILLSGVYCWLLLNPAFSFVLHLLVQSAS